MKIPEDVGSKYRYIILAGQRVAQLQKGAKPRLEELDDEIKHTQIALRELVEGKLNFQKIEEEESKEKQEPEAEEKETASS